MAMEKPWTATPEEREVICREFDKAIKDEKENARTEKEGPPKSSLQGRVTYYAFLTASVVLIALVPGAVVLSMLCMLKYLRS